MVKQGTSTVMPRLRFPEFQREMAWKTWQLGDVCELYQPETVPSSSFTAEGAHLVYGAGGIIGRLDRFNHEGAEVIIGCRGVCGNASLTKPRSWITGNAMVVRPKADKLSKPFLFHSLDAADLSPVISGSAQPQITRQGLRRFSISTPAAAEQQKIADCLTSLDEVIAAQGRIVAALKKYKRGLMQQLFPREGETRPRLRFPEFRDAPEWKKLPLCDLGEIVTGKTPSTTDAERWGGDVLFITPTDISENNKYQRSSQRTVVATPKLKVLPAGSITYTCIASIGKMAITVRPSITNQQINSVVTLPTISNEFVYYALANLTPWIKSIPASSTLAIINKKDFSGIDIWIPVDSSEQKVVADCLSSLDTQIAAETDQLAALKTHKQGLMQQLFPSREVVAA